MAEKGFIKMPTEVNQEATNSSENQECKSLAQARMQDNYSAQSKQPGIL